MAIITRWRMPPESWCGYSPSRRAESADAYEVEHLARALEGSTPRHIEMAHDVLGDLRADRQHGVEAGHRLLEDHRDAMAAQALHLGLAQGRELTALEADRARGDAAGPRRDQPQDRQRRHRLAAAQFAHDAQRLAGRQIERHAIDGAHDTVQRVELGVEVADLQDGRHGSGHSRLARRGSRRSRRPSPSRFTASTAAARKTPGIRMVQGAI